MTPIAEYIGQDWPPHAKFIVNWAYEQVGIEEATGNNDGRPAELYTGGRLEPWCGHLCATAYRLAGIPLPGDVVPSVNVRNPVALIDDMEKLAKAAGWWVSPDDAPKPGDIGLCKTRAGSDPARNKIGGRPARHAFIVVYVAARTIRTVEGNLDHRVQKLSRPRASPIFTGWIRYPV